MPRTNNKEMGEPPLYDVVIIGAGVTGCAVAREVSRQNWRTLILDQNLEPGEATSKANSAIVHAGYDCEVGTLKAKLNVRGAQRIPKLAQMLDFPYEPTGSLVLAFTPDEEAVLQALLQRGRANGVEGLSLLSRQEVLALEGALSDEVRGALLCTSAGIVCPFAMTLAFLENAMANGVIFQRDRQVLNIIPHSDGFLLETSQGPLQTRTVVNAAGIHAADLGAMVGDHEYTIHPRKGEYRLLDRSEGAMVSHVIFQAPTPLGKGVLVTPTVHGNLMIGPNSVAVSEEEFLKDTTPSGLAQIDALARRSVPGLRLQKTIRVFSGLRATPDTGDFMIYESRQSPGFFHAGGIESPGLASSPAIGEMVYELMCRSGRLPEDPKEHWISERRGIPNFSHMSAEQKKAAIAEDPAWGHVVCRCETVTEKEILLALRSPAAAITMDGVKRRVRPGMGRCQGTFCGPKVMALLAAEQGIPITQVLKDSKGSAILRARTKEELGRERKDGRWNQDEE
ncbi:Glycerol-3-phosphate dehydrogenase [Clostridiaceae bacterium JG1575]|nr:Glycerol-3-phosphate dehydrogenase [Clostridiaceae bacterium JG1575]